MDVLGTIITAIISSAAVAALINMLSNDKNQKLKYITEERAKWRADVKMNASRIYSGDYKNNTELKTLTTHLMLSLNPLKNTVDVLDHKITDLLKEIESGEVTPEALNDFRGYIGILLKFDWERSKNEALPFYKRELEDTIKRRYLISFYLQEGKRQSNEHD